MEDRPAKWESYSAVRFDAGELGNTRLGELRDPTDITLLRHLWRMLGSVEELELARLDIELPRADIAEKAANLAGQLVDALAQVAGRTDRHALYHFRDQEPEPKPRVKLGTDVIEHDLVAEDLACLVSATGSGKTRLARKVLHLLRRDETVTGVRGVLMNVHGHLPYRRNAIHVVALLDPAGSMRVPTRVWDAGLRRTVLRIERRRGPAMTTYAGTMPDVVVQAVLDHVAAQGTPPRRTFTPNEQYGLDPYMGLADAAVYVVRTYYGSDRFSSNQLPSGDLLATETWTNAGYHPVDAQAIAAGMEAMWDSNDECVRADFDPRDLARGADDFLWSNALHEAD